MMIIFYITAIVCAFTGIMLLAQGWNKYMEVCRTSEMMTYAETRQGIGFFLILVAVIVLLVRLLT